MAGKLPVGIQDFVGLRRDEFVYVDKTAYIYRLAESGKQFFLSRPRRFGKSLFLSALRAYWEGRKDLFRGLAIEALERRKESPWQTHPVIYFDFNGANYREGNALESILAYHLRKLERQYEIEPGENGLGERFREIVKTAHQNSGRRVVVLVDEYDKPLIESMEITIRSFDRRKGGCILCFPNQEVRYGFLDSLLPAYVPKMSNLAGTDIFSLDEAGIRE